jgi:3'-phosphoadenosine 5'-phosphosulfate sulfotransferase (PAPS reductase)/FAD synthetase
MFPFERTLIERKIEEAHKVIREALTKMTNPYVAWSGGKDSTIVLHLVLQHKPDIAVVHLDADADFPETVEYMERLRRDWNLNLITVKTKPLLDLVARYGYSDELTRIIMKAVVYEPIKRIIKQHGFDGCFLGVRHEESYGRSKLLRAQGKLFFNKTYRVWQCLPIGWWTLDDVFRYYEYTNIPLHPFYREHLFEPLEQRRVSYFAGGTAKEKGRFVTAKFYHIGLYNEIRKRTRWVSFFS